MRNPFFFGSLARGAAFFGRQCELRLLLEIIQKGNSAALSAEPRLGKTSLLYQLQQRDLYEGQASNIHFVYLDAQNLIGWNVPRFWEAALLVFKENDAVRDAYRSASLEKFGTFLLERFFIQLEEAGLRLVLLLDEFDQVLEEPGLHKAEFYGSLRTLASRYPSFSLVLSARQPVEELNRRTQEYSRLGSPYFNFVNEIPLGAFSAKEMAEVLAQAGEQFSGDDRRYLAKISGGHPYFLQCAAYYLWEAYVEKQKDPVKRRELAGEQAYAKAAPVLNDSWRTWSPHQQMAFTLAALDEMPRLLPSRNFDINRLLKDRPNFAPEQRILKQRGFLKEDTELQGGYAPQAEVMTWFLAEELTRLLRPADPDVASWIQSQQWDGILKKGEKDAIGRTLLALKPILKDGSVTFIKAAAEGVAKGITGVK